MRISSMAGAPLVLERRSVKGNLLFRRSGSDRSCRPSQSLWLGGMGKEGEAAYEEAQQLIAVLPQRAKSSTYKSASKATPLGNRGQSNCCHSNGARLWKTTNVRVRKTQAT